MTSARWHRLQQLGMCLLLVLVIVSVIVVRGSSLPVPAAVNEIDESLLEPGDLCSWTSTMAGVRAATGIMWRCMWRIPIQLSWRPPTTRDQPDSAGRRSWQRDLPADVSVRRLKDIPDRDEIIRIVVEYALAQVGQPFDYTATATLPFKINESNLHCAEVAWRSYMAAGVDLDSNGGLLVYPDDIYFSPKLGTP